MSVRLEVGFIRCERLRRQHKGRSFIMLAAGGRGSVQHPVENGQTGNGSCAVGTARKVVEYGLLAVRGHAENGSTSSATAAAGSPGGGGPVQRAVQGSQTRFRKSTVAVAIIEAVHEVFLTVSGYAENGAAAAGSGASGARTALESRSVQRAVQGNHARHRRRTGAPAREAIEDVLFACRAQSEDRAEIGGSPRQRRPVKRIVHERQVSDRVVRRVFVSEAASEVVDHVVHAGRG